MSPKEFDQFVGPKQQQMAEWSSRQNGKIVFQLLVMLPMSPADAEYLFGVLDLAKGIITRSMVED